MLACVHFLKGMWPCHKVSSGQVRFACIGCVLGSWMDVDMGWRLSSNTLRKRASNARVGLGALPHASC